MEDNVLFCYILKTSYGIPVSRITIYDMETNNVRLHRFDSKQTDGDTDIIKPETMTLRPVVTEKLREILREHAGMFGMDSVETPPGTEGTRNYFYCSLDGQILEVFAENIWYFENEDARDEKGKEPYRARHLLRLFRETADLLTKAGVDECYFRLNYED